jgi:arylsulfatase A-like enzyme
MNKPNIIHITFDSGRQDHMGFAGYAKGTTPFLDSLAAKSMWFKRAYATGPGSSVSFVGMFTSTYPLDYGGYGSIEPPRVLLSEALRQAGYATIGIHSSPYLSDYFGYNRGWSVFRYLNFFKKTPAGSVPMSPGLRQGTAKSAVLKKTAAGHEWLRARSRILASMVKFAERLLLTLRKILKDALDYRPAFFIAEEMNRELLKELDALDGRPVYLWLHYLDAHAPYGLFYRRGKGFLKALKFHATELSAFLFADFPSVFQWFIPLQISTYNDSLRYVDENIKTLLIALKERGVLNDDAVVVIHADHGEEFLEHGSFGHPQKLFNVNVQVPLIMHGPKHFKPETVERPVSLVDVGPTLLALAGAPIPDTYKGKNLLSTDERPVVVQASESAGDLTDRKFTGIAIIARGYKFFRWKDKKYLFALDDRAEQRDLYGARRDVANELEHELKPYLPIMPEQGMSSKT